MEEKDQKLGAPSARTATRCGICQQEISDDPGDFGTRCIRTRMGAPSTAAMVCYRLGFERLCAELEIANNARADAESRLADVEADRDMPPSTHRLAD